MTSSKQITVIKPTGSWGLPNFREAVAYRDLLTMLLFRNIKSRYAQSILGIGWAIVDPLFKIVIFSVIFGKLANINSEGTPYILYSSIAIIPWNFFAGNITGIGNSLNSFGGILTKIYFPRILIPISTLLSNIVDFAISFTIVIFLLFWYRVFPNSAILYFPLVFFILLINSLGIGIWISTFVIKYRDVSYSLTLITQVLMYASPVVYGIQEIPEKYKVIYMLNPMVGILESFRTMFLGTNPMPWLALSLSALIGWAILFTSLIRFKATEKYFADVI